MAASEQVRKQAELQELPVVTIVRHDFRFVRAMFLIHGVGALQHRILST